MLKMKRNILKITAVLGIATLALNSCGPKENTPLVYFPDMYYPVAYDPLMKAEIAYSDHENEIPAFVKNNGATGLSPVEGSVAQNKDGVFEEGKLPKNPDEYNAGYDASKKMMMSPLNPANAAKDIERGKILFDHTCSACHGTGGDGQGPIVQSGAYSGVPNYADRDITVGSIHYVITNGRNAMGSYAGQLNAGDRWRVAMYVMSAFKKGGTTATAATTDTAAKKDSTATKK
ncbi:quinol:cytochrome C oxidoreductase [Chryseobacterium sp. Leaf180]|uniref:c-type cytochrome n=1 Tax=Chryseobacterium sp. Leaf180 TaxID=1736289 RepID=UPI0006F31CD9|nr:cytochrome c [Chryseobacterium sp. Leaf180]KQR95346.1 quinol:cytochrome C oxidoreductase [Chryseobacterium sp. Leaf180]